ncbi:MAG TPA: 4-alpha-glucanotransferase, partial [bacterium]|nr:4-alpha-glucanotransferase [bacterium]
MRVCTTVLNWYEWPMQITFRLRFATQPGQSLWLAGTHPLPGHPVAMHYVDAEFWEVTIPLSTQAASARLNYSYVLRNADGSQTTDWGRDRAFVPAQFKRPELLVIDSWNAAGFFANAFYTEPFRKLLPTGNFKSNSPLLLQETTHTFQVKSPLLTENQTLCLIGEGPALGQWQTESPIMLEKKPGASDFSVSLDLRGQSFPFAYKFGVYDFAQKSFVRFEGGDNRRLKAPAARNQHVIVNGGFTVLPTDTWRGAGVAIPVFSLRSEKSFGVGEFADLKLLADWGKTVGLKLIQLLPINDTTATKTWKDSYPYAAISAFALHPIYLNLAALANAKNKLLLKALEPTRRKLNALDAVDYEAVMKVKLDFLKQIFASQKAATLRAKEYKSFFAENEHWLVPYAAFCVLRDRFGSADFSQWPDYQTYSAEKIAALAKDNDEIAFHYFIQYHLHLQLKDATA